VFLAIAGIFVVRPIFISGDPLWPPSGFQMLLIGFGATVFALMLWSGIRSRIRVIIDHRNPCLVVVSGEGRVELPLRQLSAASYAHRNDLKGRRTYRLEIVLRSGEHVPVTSSYHHYSGSDCIRVVEAINQELALRGEMLG
jgi:hypothetical protein